jgi:epoxyqueuosine reductase
MPDVEAVVRKLAADEGLTLVGCTPITPLDRDAFLAAWLADGRAGEMRWLERRTEIRLDPRRQFPWARGMIVVGWPYRPAPPPPGDWRTTLRGRIAAYALGRDYHHALGDRLDALATRLAACLPGARFLSYVDTGAILEREWAWRAGLGWIGKHTLTLGTERGSWMLLGELVTSLPLDAGARPIDRCGACRRCVAACPTDALAGDYSMDPRRCLSYLTIEHRSALPRALRPALGNWIFGCDLCQDVCPWGAGTDGVDGPARDWLHPDLTELLSLDEAGFGARFGGSAVARARRPGLLRNVAVALGNSDNPDAVPPLIAALEDDATLVREHAAWALGRLGGARAARALERALGREPTAAVAAEIRIALGG